MTRALADVLDDDPGPFRGIVYFIESQSAIKIGYTTDLGKRLADLKTASSESLSILEYIRGGKEIEAEFHKLLASERLSGEWFRKTDKTEDLMYLLSDFLDTYDDEDDRMLDGRDSHVLTLKEMRTVVADPYYWRRDE